MNHQSICPAAVAFGIAVLLAGLVIDPWALTPLGALIVLVAGTAWARSPLGVPSHPADAARRASSERADERFPGGGQTQIQGPVRRRRAVIRPDPWVCPIGPAQ